MFIPKVSYGYGEPKNVIIESVEKVYGPLRILQSTRFHAAPYWTDSANLEKLLAADHNGAPKQCLYEKEATGMENLKGSYAGGEPNNIIVAFVQKKVEISTGVQIIHFHVVPYMADNGNLRKFGATYRHCNMFETKQYLYRKEAMGEDSPKNLILKLVQKDANLYGHAN